MREAAKIGDGANDNCTKTVVKETAINIEIILAILRVILHLTRLLNEELQYQGFPYILRLFLRTFINQSAVFITFYRVNKEPNDLTKEK